VKELFKLSNGKYVAPAAIEEALQLSPFISQCVVYGDNQPYVVALIVVDREVLSSWARDNSVEASDLLSHPRTHELYAAEIEARGRELKGYERVRTFVLEQEPLTTENGMLTPTFKVRRRKITERYAARLSSLYAAAAE
jgi:long-chain acyl-CoA synthetase